MALVIQNVDMTPSYLPYERPPQNFTLWSAIPRGLQSFIVATGELDAKPLNDTFLLNLKATLPPNFAYVLQDLKLDVAVNTGFDWSVAMSLNLQNYYRAPEILSVPLSSTWRGDFDIADALLSQTRTSRWRGNNPLPSFPIIGAKGTSGALITISASNKIAAAGAIGVINSYIAFWQFDLEQVRKYPINSPQPVHTR